MKTILTYNRARQLFTKSEFKPFVHKYFKDVEYLGALDSYGTFAHISISNWDEIKDKLPKYAIPAYNYPDTPKNRKI